MDGGGAIERIADQFVDGGDDALGVQLPVNQQAISGQAAVQRAGGHAVEIGIECARDGAQAIEIEMGVAGLQRIEGPFNMANAAMQRFVALEEFQQAANAAVAMRGEDAGHV